MTSEKTLWMALIAVAIIAVLGLFLPMVKTPSLGAVTGTTNYSNLALSGTLAVTGATTLGGNTTITTSNTATSTVTVGCIQTTATSTATPIRLVPGSGANATTTFNGTNAVGVIGWQYGTCPN